MAALLAFRPSLSRTDCSDLTNETPRTPFLVRHRGKYRIEGRDIHRRMTLEGQGKCPGDVGEADLSAKEGRNRQLVGDAVSSGIGAAGGDCLPSETERGKSLIVERRELQLPHRAKIERTMLVRQSVGIGERKLDG